MLVTVTSTDGNIVTYDYNLKDNGFLSSKTTINVRVDYDFNYFYDYTSFSII